MSPLRGCTCFIFPPESGYNNGIPSGLMSSCQRFRTLVDWGWMLDTDTGYEDFTDTGLAQHSGRAGRGGTAKNCSP